MKNIIVLFLGVAVLIFAAQTFARDGHGNSGYHGYSRHGGYGYGHGYGHGGHHSGRSYFDFHVGVPLIWPRVDYYRAPYPVTQVVIERQPQVYVQREVAAAAPAASNFWYYCPDSRTYYPYAQSCTSAWLQVVPQTSPQVTR